MHMLWNSGLRVACDYLWLYKYTLKKLFITFMGKSDYFFLSFDMKYEWGRLVDHSRWFLYAYAKDKICNKKIETKYEKKNEKNMFFFCCE